MYVYNLVNNLVKTKTFHDGTIFFHLSYSYNVPLTYLFIPWFRFYVVRKGTRGLCTIFPISCCKYKSSYP